MPEEKKKQHQTQQKVGSDNDLTNDVSLNELAKKIVALLLRELDIERERTGR